MLFSLKMASPIPIIVGIVRDGQWHVQSGHLIGMLIACALPFERCAKPPKRGCRRLPPRPPPTPPPARIPSSQCLADVLESLRAFSADDGQTLQLSSDFLVRLSKIESLGTRRVDSGERFGGKLAHWSKLVEATGAPNIVVYIRADKHFYVVCARARHTQMVETRSALCWLRDGAGLGFLGDEGDVFRIEASRNFFVDDEEDPWGESLSRLLSSASVMFPVPTLDEC